MGSFTMMVITADAQRTVSGRVLRVKSQSIAHEEMQPATCRGSTTETTEARERCNCIKLYVFTSIVDVVVAVRHRKRKVERQSAACEELLEGEEVRSEDCTSSLATVSECVNVNKRRCSRRKRLSKHTLTHIRHYGRLCGQLQ